VVHLDDSTIAALGRLYAELLPQGGLLLDLMSSWRTHLPDGFDAGQVIRLGMNAEEMADNPQLFRFQVQDLNRKRRFPYGKNPNFEGAVCAVSIQYLTHPICVFREVHRVLCAGAPFVVTFSNRCLPPKAIALWLATDDRQHLDLFVYPAAGRNRSPRIARREQGAVTRCMRSGRGKRRRSGRRQWGYRGRGMW
jgi:hypothetical protein